MFSKARNLSKHIAGKKPITGISNDHHFQNPQKHQYQIDHKQLVKNN